MNNLLEPPPHNWQALEMNFKRLSGPYPLIHIEQAGRAFEMLLANHGIEPHQKPLDLGFFDATTNITEKQEVFEYDSDQDYEDHYSVLKIHNGPAATKFQIDSNYRKLRKAFHPDKNINGNIKKIEKIFNSIQESYEVLNSPQRREYDSTLSYDDSIPSIKHVEIQKEFFNIFGPVFERNALFSIIHPVPTLYDSDFEDFYDFWRSFRSWRQFPSENEYDINEAVDRTERRWMERENKRCQAQLLKAESERIRNFVDLAYSLDPRIKAHKDLENAKRLAKQQERLKAKQKREEEQRLQEENRKKEEQLRLEEENRIIIEKKQEKAKLKKLRGEFRSINKNLSNSNDTNEDIINQYLLKQTFMGLSELIIELNKLTDDEKIYKIDLEIQNFTEEEKKIQENSKKESPKKVKIQSTPWSREEIIALHKALLKFPVGSRNRYGMVSNLIGRSENEIIKKSKELKEKGKDQLSELQSDAYNVWIKSVEKKSQATEKKMLVIDDKKGREHDKAVSNAKNSNVWSKEQQKAFENALRSMPGSLPVNERWEKIAERVNGKSSKDCIKRFKDIREKLIKKKS